MQISDVRAIDDLLIFKDTQHQELQISPDGEKRLITLSVRENPLILGFKHYSKVAPNRASTTIPEFAYEQMLDTATHFAEIQQIPHWLVQASQGKAVRDPLDAHLEMRIRAQKAKCVFCLPNLLRQAERIGEGYLITHEGIMTDQGEPIVSFTPSRVYLTDHYVTVFTGHKLKPSEITLSDMANYFSSGQQIAMSYRRQGAIGIFDGMNFGRLAGASVFYHPHTHRGSIKDTEQFRRESPRAAHMSDLINSGVIPDGFEVMERYMEKIRHEHPELVIADDSGMFAYAAFAPLVPDHVEVIFKDNRYGGSAVNYPPEILRVLGASTTGLIDGLHRKRGVAHFNYVVHQATFSDGPNGFPIQVSILPAGKRIDGVLERMGIESVVDNPSITAMALKEHFEKPLILNHHP